MTTSPGAEAATDAPQVSILIVAYNSRATIRRCIEAVALGAQRIPVEILLVDNGEDGTGELVAQTFPHVRVIAGQGNIGFARANNLLAPHARAPYLLLLNPDFFMMEGAVDALMDGARRYPDAGAWGGVSYDERGVPDTSNSIAIPTLRQLASAAIGLSIAGRAVPDLSRDERVDVLSGGFVMLSRTAWDRAEGFDGRFFLYCEEVDLFQRLRAMGYPLWRLADAKGEHMIAHGQGTSPRRLLYMTTGIMEYVRKHWGFPGWLVGAGLIWIAAVERYLAGKLLGRRNTRLAKLGEAYRVIARWPHLWVHGYDPKKGLLTRQLPHL
ncbi:glycosyltransferase family 2 protein [Altererythrobacter lauratis]|uniref:Glycosyltransferase family 2 protein n=1 Tax=Alteraurantiacibacter lauratis TaxID=2054627 RepID=A0ABV7EE70_9SPHN